MPETPQDILEVNADALAQWLKAEGQPAYRLGQVLDWVYREFVESFAAMTNLPLPLRARLAEAYGMYRPREVGRLRSHDGASEKFLFALEDGEQIESVWMDDGGRTTFCISSQAGCALNCRFCATGAAGFGRNLKAKEILGQVTALARAKGRPSSIVFMGMGEPLLNLKAVVPALESLADPQRFGIGARRITVSTAGVTPAIAELAVCPVRPNLALSLNSPYDAQRSQLMPINRKHPLAGVLSACEDYAAITGRRLVLEYVLLGGTNTSPQAARDVAEIARKLRALVNLIELNPVAGCGFRPPSREETTEFRRVLTESGVQVTQRFRRGRDITAACGQLTGRHPHQPASAKRRPSAVTERTPRDG
jgi:23S rRNA (adenine2503-C2)-methyltransferase